MGHVKSCGLYLGNNGKPLRGCVGQDGDMMIHGMLEAHFGSSSENGFQR